MSAPACFKLDRVRTDELMDDPHLAPSRHAEALSGLARLNRFSAAAETLWNTILPIAKRHRGKEIRVLEIASGGGDVLFDLGKKAARSGVPVQFTGSDLSRTALNLAQKKFGHKTVRVEFLQIDALNDAFPEGFDIIMTSLFTHHLDPEQVKLLLRKMYSAAQTCVIVNDLERSAVNLALVWIATRVLTRSDVVHYDGPVSVRAAYTPNEFLTLAAEAGLENCTAQRIFPCRFLFSSLKHENC